MVSSVRIWKWKLTKNGHKITLWGDRIVLKLNCVLKKMNNRHKIYDCKNVLKLLLLKMGAFYGLQIILQFLKCKKIFNVKKYFSDFSQMHLCVLALSCVITTVSA